MSGPPFCKCGVEAVPHIEDAFSVFCYWVCATKKCEFSKQFRTAIPYCDCKKNNLEYGVKMTLDRSGVFNRYTWICINRFYEGKRSCKKEVPVFYDPTKFTLDNCLRCGCKGHYSLGCPAYQDCFGNDIPKWAK